MGRQAAMSSINAALLQPTTAAPSASNSSGSSAPSAPHAAPGITAPTPLTADEKRGFDAARITRLDDEKQTDKLSQQQQAAVQQELLQQQKQQDIFDKTSSSAVNSAKKIVHGAGVKLERIPTPGSIMLPLVILLVFFFLLIPVNGHTRLQWLWLVVTGNADINGSGSQGAFASGDFASPTGGISSASGDFGNSSNSNSSASGSIGGFASGDFASMPIPNFSLGSMMTGAEDI